MMNWIWLGAVVTFGVLEAATAALVSIWFVGGAAVALLGNRGYRQRGRHRGRVCRGQDLDRPQQRRHGAAHRDPRDCGANGGRQALCEAGADKLHAAELTA